MLATRIAEGDTETPMRSSRLVRLCAENSGLAAIARAGETDHQPVADQLVVAYTLDRDQIFQTGGPRRQRRGDATGATGGIRV